MATRQSAIPTRALGISPKLGTQMQRELPMFQPPNVNGGHGHGDPFQPPTIAMGGGGFGPAADGSTAPRRHPDWIKARLPSGENYHDLKSILRGLTLNTVCEEAHCPNIGECWEQRTATIMILGDVCTRACGFCAVKTGRPTWNDEDEPRRVAEAIAKMNLEHVVVTSVARDDLADGGAHIFAETIRAIRRDAPNTGRRGAHPRLQRPGRAAADRHGGRTRTSSTTTSRRSSGCRSRCASARAISAAWMCSSGPRNSLANSAAATAPCTPNRA